MSIQEQSRNLSHHSLEAFILNIIQRDDVFNFFPMLSHSKIQTIQKDCYELLLFFASGTYNQINQHPNLKLNKSQTKKIKQLTILTSLQRKTEISLFQLQKILSIDRNQLIDLIIELNIQKVILTKIDQKCDLLQILFSQVRGKQYNQEETNVSQARIEQIIIKNKQILRQINKCLDKSTSQASSRTQNELFF